jgi:glutamate synthase (NADPH/NADH)
VNYLTLVAEEARNIMAKLGFRTMEEMIGKAEALRVDPSIRDGPLHYLPILMPAHRLPDAGKIGKVELHKMYAQDHFPVLNNVVDRQFVADCAYCFRYGGRVTITHNNLLNRDRTTGTLLSHELYKRWGNSLQPGTCHVKLMGTSGQSFGAFAVKGLFMELEGDSQDYFGKGLSGGALAVYPSKAAVADGFVPEENIIAGNTCLYGATMGMALLCGMAGERFAVRNSGVWAVVEGIGEHGCEYMTGGRIAVLGKTGGNFGAGMTGGCAWVWDPEDTFKSLVNPQTLELTRMSATQPHAVYSQDGEDLRSLLEAHVKFTGSAVAQGILAKWPESLANFTRAIPKDYIAALQKDAASGKPKRMAALSDWLPVLEGKEQKPVIESQQTKTKPKDPKQLIPTDDIEDIQKFMKGNRPSVVEVEKFQSKAVKKGFIEYDRADLPKRSVEERMGDFKEIYATKDMLKIQTQAARCMDCGTPFCHQSVTEKSGCPLGNLIPEWNELVKQGSWREAFTRLQQTNNFPEFTGRVCPAPCEGACVLGIIDDPVSIKSIELSIVDKAYEMGWMKPVLPPFRSSKAVAIIGSGPAGLACADQLNKMGHLVTVFERADRVGGLMMYGVPNMKTDKVDIVERRVQIMREEGIRFITGPAGNVGAIDGGSADIDGAMGPTADQLMEEFDSVVLATGATVGRDMGNTPGRELQGVHLAMEYLTKNTKALLDGGETGQSWRQWYGGPGSGHSKITPIDAKGKKVLVIGGGDTGNDCIGTAARQGATAVVNLELLPRPPDSRAPENNWPHWPHVFKVDYGHEETAKALNSGQDIREYQVATKEFVAGGSGNVVGVKVVSVQWKNQGGQMKMVEVPGSERIIEADLVFLALGFLGPESSLAEMFKVDVDARSNYKATYNNAPHDFRTSNPKVFATGDCRRGQSLVVWAIKEGRDCADSIHRYLIDSGSDFSPKVVDSPQIAAAL